MGGEAENAEAAESKLDHHGVEGGLFIFNRPNFPYWLYSTSSASQKPLGKRQQ
jgi:hypothetical protein